MEQIIINPIGILRSEFKNRYETPRQGVLAGESIAVIELLPQMNFEQAVKGLEGFERLWIIYQFHLNSNWKPMIVPPRHTNRKKVGVFSSRAPYRPNPIGISCVKLEKVEGLKIFISNSDILDGSPILDIKPYLPYSDSFPGVKTGWVKSGMEVLFDIEFTSEARQKINWLKDNCDVNLDNFAKLQLEFYPTDDSRKRIQLINEETKSYCLSYRTWRIFYSVEEKEKRVQINNINSGYTENELEDLQNDKYNDKSLHTKFRKYFE